MASAGFRAIHDRGDASPGHVEDPNHDSAARRERIGDSRDRIERVRAILGDGITSRGRWFRAGAVHASRQDVSSPDKLTG